MRTGAILAPGPLRYIARRMKGVVAAGHPLTADAGAQVLRAGGNAVDAALAAMAASFVAEPQLTGLGAGGFMLVAEPGEAPALLDFFVSTSGVGADPSRRAPLVAAEVFFGTVAQVFHVGPSSCGVYGTPAGMCEAHRRYATHAARRARRARRPARARGRRGQRAAGLHLPPARAAVRGQRRGAREILGRRPRGARGRRAEQPRARRPRSSASRRRARRRSTPATSPRRRSRG